MGELKDALQRLSQSDMYPFHMPGHKRNMEEWMNPYACDITEIDGFDNLHHPEGLLLELQRRAAVLWRTKRSYLLVNGSTCGLLAAVSAVLPVNGHLLMARNCHKAAYHAAYLRSLRLTYLYPARTQCGIQGGITPRQVQEALEKDSSIQAVLVVSPTYDGVVSDIEGIARVAHEHGVPLLVDEAHGAHLGFHKAFPSSAVQCGADVVVQSLHKTLPAFTQSAILHLCSRRVPEDRLAWFLTVYQSSSPSYLLLQGMEQCMDFLESEGEKLFDAYARRLERFFRQTEELRQLRVLTRQALTQEEAFALDPSKLVISGRPAAHGAIGRSAGDGNRKAEPERAGSLTGHDLYTWLRERYHLQMEMCQGDYVLAMTSIMDTQEGIDRLWWALKEIDRQLDEGLEHEQWRNAAGQRSGRPEQEQAASGCPVDYISLVYGSRPQAMALWEAMDSPRQEVILEQAQDRISGDFVSLYPPGIPLLVPGEVITGDALEAIRLCMELQGSVHGIREGKIKVVIS